MILTQIKNEYMSEVLFKSLSIQGNQGDIYNNFKGEVRVLHIHAGHWECWNEFTDSCKIGQHPQGNNQLHPTGHNSLAFLCTRIRIITSFQQLIK